MHRISLQWQLNLFLPQLQITCQYEQTFMPLYHSNHTVSAQTRPWCNNVITGGFIWPSMVASGGKCLAESVLPIPHRNREIGLLWTLVPRREWWFQMISCRGAKYPKPIFSSADYTLFSSSQVFVFIIRPLSGTQKLLLHNRVVSWWGRWGSSAHSGISINYLFAPKEIYCSIVLLLT